MKVLVADDSSMWRKIIASHVEDWGFEPVVAEDGAQAWEILQQDTAPRLAILDWLMPEIDGIDLCRRVKLSPDHPFTYVIVLTGRDAAEDMVAALNSGADDYLTKPVTPPILRSRLMAAKRIVEAIPPKEWSKPQVDGYEVERLLGKGSFATVWQATHLESQRQMALKILRVDLATEEVFSRFQREIEMMKQMDHPNIARVYDSHIDRKLGYCAMELIEGPTLEAYVVKKKPRTREVFSIVIQVANGLEHAHRQGVVHRDLKPSNIMLTNDGEPKIVDFGMGKSLFQVDAEEETTQTIDGSVVGTPLFMAPEQARGENDLIDGRTDIYALGIILYLILVRKHPHNVDRKDRWKTVKAIAEGAVKRPSEVVSNFNLDLERIMMKALADNPSDRYQTAQEFAKALKQYVLDREEQARLRGSADGTIA